MSKQFIAGVAPIVLLGIGSILAARPRAFSQQEAEVKRALPQRQVEGKKAFDKDAIRGSVVEKYAGIDGIDLDGFVVQMADVGKVSDGVILHEATDKSELTLDVQPCRGHVEVFNMPYEKTDTGLTTKCGDKTFYIVRVKQERTTPTSSGPDVSPASKEPKIITPADKKPEITPPNKKPEATPADKKPASKPEAKKPDAPPSAGA